MASHQIVTNVITWSNGEFAIREECQWNMKQNRKIIFHDNAFEHVVCQLAAILLHIHSKSLMDPFQYFNFFCDDISMSSSGCLCLIRYCKKFHALLVLNAIFTFHDFKNDNIDGLVQDCSISMAKALEIQQSYTEPPTVHYGCRSSLPGVSYRKSQGKPVWRWLGHHLITGGTAIEADPLEV